MIRLLLGFISRFVLIFALLSFALWVFPLVLAAFDWIAEKTQPIVVVGIIFAFIFTTMSYFVQND